MVGIIIKDKPRRFGKTRTEQARNLEREGWGTGFKSHEDFDRAKYLEKKGMRFPTIPQIERTK